MYPQSKPYLAMVDDNEIDLEVVAYCLKKSRLSSLTLESFYSGQEFLSFILDKFIRSKPLPSIVLMDINMDFMSGFDVIDKARELTSEESLRFVMLLNKSCFEIDLVDCKKHRVKEHLYKSQDPKEYIKYFNQLTV